MSSASLKSKISVTGKIKGIASVRATIIMVVINKYLLGLLLKIGLLLLITSTIRDVEITDSINHAVLNCPIVAFKIIKRIVKVI